MDILYVVVPCYNEEEVLLKTAAALKAKMRELVEDGGISPESRVLFVNDGSSDRTWDIIRRLHGEDPVFSGLSLSRNRGHQNALFAGLMTAAQYCDAAISIDADLQDDINCIDGMLARFRQGCDIVYGVRSDRASDNALKRGTAEGYYRFMRFMGADFLHNHADCRLMSKRALDGLSQFKERNLFLRGIVPMIGYKSDIVTYVRKKRAGGKSKYSLKKMLSLAFDGLTSFTTKPIWLILVLGLCMIAAGIVMMIAGIIRYAAGLPGLSPAMVSIWIVGGIVTAAVGIVGEYVGKAYMETKERPRYIVEEFLHKNGSVPQMRNEKSGMAAPAHKESIKK